MKPRLVVALLFLFWLVCTRAQTTSGTYASFQDQTAELGLDLANGAACWIDVDSDGWVDIISKKSTGDVDSFTFLLVKRSDR